MTFKPFNKLVRNTRCLRCGEWGHQTGDRECTLRDFNPHDAARCVVALRILPCVRMDSVGRSMVVGRF